LIEHRVLNSDINDGSLFLTGVVCILNNIKNWQGTDISPQQQLKGVFSIAAREDQCYVQAVCEVYDKSFRSQRLGSKEFCRVILIGKNLDHTTIKESFEHLIDCQ